MTQRSAMQRDRRGFERALGVVPGLVLAAVLGAALAGPVLAEDGRPIRFGARTDAPPMAYEDSEGVLRGYSIDICDEVRKVFAELFPERRIEDGYVKVTAGVIESNRIIMDTSDSNLVAWGAIDLGQELVDLRVQAYEKDFSLIDASAPVAVTGSLRDPEIAIGGTDLLPFFERGEADDLSCDALLSGRITPQQVEEAQ